MAEKASSSMPLEKFLTMWLKGDANLPAGAASAYHVRGRYADFLLQENSNEFVLHATRVRNREKSSEFMFVSDKLSYMEPTLKSLHPSSWTYLSHYKMEELIKDPQTLRMVGRPRHQDIMTDAVGVVSRPTMVLLEDRSKSFFLSVIPSIRQPELITPGKTSYWAAHRPLADRQAKHWTVLAKKNESFSSVEECALEILKPFVSSTSLLWGWTVLTPAEHPEEIEKKFQETLNLRFSVDQNHLMMMHRYNIEKITGTSGIGNLVKKIGCESFPNWGDIIQKAENKLIWANNSPWLKVINDVSWGRTIVIAPTPESAFFDPLGRREYSGEDNKEGPFYIRGKIMAVATVKMGLPAEPQIPMDFFLNTWYKVERLL